MQKARLNLDLDNKAANKSHILESKISFYFLLTFVLQYTDCPFRRTRHLIAVDKDLIFKSNDYIIFFHLCNLAS